MNKPSRAGTAHWTVKTNYRLRTGSFIDVFVAIVLHGWGKHYSAALWTAIALHLLVYPHVIYQIARRAVASQEAEVNNLTVDCLLFGLLMGALQFPLWITFTVYIASSLNITISRGMRGLRKSQLAFFAGAGAAVAVFGWHPDPETGWASIWLCVIGNAVYLGCIGVVAYDRNQQLRKTREALRSGELALQAQLVEIQALRDKLQDQAVRDPLTGLHNRRHLESVVEIELARCARENLPMALAMIDVDHFKKVNDTHGHPAGDKVLRALAAVLIAEVRPTDSACRYGGEEFVLLLPGMDAEVALNRANEWRQAFSKVVVECDGAEIRATVSIGIASYPGQGVSLQELIHNADLALYAAKREGRDRAMVFRTDAQGAPDGKSGAACAASPMAT